MTTVIRTSLLIGLAFTQNYVVGDILKSEVFIENTSNTSCTWLRFADNSNKLGFREGLKAMG